LNRRLKEYLNIYILLEIVEKGNSAILNAILKYALLNFGIRILEIIEFDSKHSKSEKKK